MAEQYRRDAQLAPRTHSLLHTAIAARRVGWKSRPKSSRLPPSRIAGSKVPCLEPPSSAALCLSDPEHLSGKIAERTPRSLAATGLEPITLHECRHTYASFLMAAGYTLRELMEYMGHSSLQATERYVKLPPPLDGTDPTDRLNAYLRRRAVK